MKHYVFVGSAGAYEANSVEPMHVEGDKRKASAGGLQMHRTGLRLVLRKRLLQLEGDKREASAGGSNVAAWQAGQGCRNGRCTIRRHALGTANRQKASLQLLRLGGA